MQVLDTWMISLWIKEEEEEEKKISFTEQNYEVIKLYFSKYRRYVMFSVPSPCFPAGPLSSAKYESYSV